jgi:cytochrome P450
VAISLLEIEQELNPFPFYKKLREENPVYFDPIRKNWNIFRFNDVQRVLSEYETFSSQFTGASNQDTTQPFAASMIATDPPKHRQLRNLVTQAFTPKAVNALQPRIHSIVNEYLDPQMGTGEIDIIADIGYPLPVIVIAELLGIPTEDRDKFKNWSDLIVSLADLGGEVDYEAFTGNNAIMEMSAYFFNLLDQRRNEPGDDLISGLLRAEIDGETLTLPELLGFCMLLLVAGNETTTNLIGNAMLLFARYPDIWRRLRNDPDGLDLAIEEVLRYLSPVQSMFRVAKQEVTLAGETIPSGAPLVAWIGSANRDGDQFPEPDKFDIQRNPNRHLAFGHGIHYCLGAPLARMEAEIALKTMLERFRSIKTVPGVELERIPSLLVYGVKSLPVEFELDR